jgi:hypothetical protein
VTASIWKGQLIQWKDRSTWSPLITEWIKPHLIPDISEVRTKAEETVEASGSLYNSDALRLLDLLVDYRTGGVIADLAEDIRDARLRVFHGTRVADAGIFHREGMRPYPRSRLVTLAEQIVVGAERLRPLLPHVGSGLSGVARSMDKGTVFTCIDDRVLTSDSSHYALYGSEWITAHLINLAANVDVGVVCTDVYEALREWGLPTVVKIDLPLRFLDDDERRIFIRDELLPDWIGEFLLGYTNTPVGEGCPIIRRRIPASAVVGHYHPRRLKDPYYRFVERSGWPTTCPHCAPSS